VSSGSGTEFYEPKKFIPKSYVDEVGHRIETARKRPAKSFKPKVPLEAVEACEKSYHAAQGDKETASSKKFDDTGIMALVCRHDIPLFFANIDTPGEQQKYAVALIEWFFEFLPQNATVAILYDIGCVLDTSLAKVCCFFRFKLSSIDAGQYDFLKDSVVQRIMFGLSAMHAYGHQWSCQLIFNPRLRPGFGLTDGEGVERLWSRLRRLIALERRSGVCLLHLLQILYSLPT
jgi:hypothetical protein